jgi:hypothetical protein
MNIKMNLIKRLKNWFMGPCTKELQMPFALPRIQPENYLCQFHSILLLCSCTLWHIVFLWLLYFRRDIVLPSSGKTYPLKLHHCCHTIFLVFDPFNRGRNSAAELAVPSQQRPTGGTRPVGSKPTLYVQCVCPVTPTTTPIFSMTRLQKCEELNSVKFYSCNFLLLSKVFVHVPLKWNFRKVCTVVAASTDVPVPSTDLIENTQRYCAVHCALSPVFVVNTRLLKLCAGIAVCPQISYVTPIWSSQMYQ